MALSANQISSSRAPANNKATSNHQFEISSKLTEVEVESLERKDESYMKTIMSLNKDWRKIEDVDQALKEAFELDKTFVYGRGGRITFTLENPLKPMGRSDCTLQ